VDAQRRHSADDLIHTLSEQPWELDFFQMCRRLEAARTDLPRLGQSSITREDAVRFGQKPSLRFPVRSIEGVEPGPAAPRVLINCFGLMGPSGPLPLVWTEYAHDRGLMHGDRTFGRFIDLFNHRMTCLFYRAWAANNAVTWFDRSDITARGEVEGLSRYIGSFAGIGTASTSRRGAASDISKRFFCGWLSFASRSPDGLRAIVSEYFGVKAQVSEFIGRWGRISQRERFVLGSQIPSQQQSSRLSSQMPAVLGSTVWHAQSAFRLILGPMDLASYQKLLPYERVKDAHGGQAGAAATTTSWAKLEDWLRTYAGLELLFEVQLKLDGASAPRMQLGGKRHTTGGSRLGWTTWLGDPARRGTRGDLIIRPSTKTGRTITAEGLSGSLRADLIDEVDS
jgi:type VI secretion system protein ImpH